MPTEPAYVPDMPALMTAEELLHVHLPNQRSELVRGVLRVREPAGSMHGRVAMNLGGELRAHARAKDAGTVFAAETGFKLFTDPDTVRAPDVVFVAKGREPPSGATGFADLAPDLAVEVLSPGDRPGEILAKVADWLSAGTRLVWVVTRSDAWRASTARTGARPSSRPKQRWRAKTCCRGSRARSQRFSSCSDHNPI